MQHPLLATILAGEQPSALVLGIDEVRADLAVEGQQLYNGLCDLTEQRASLPISVTEVILVTNTANDVWDVFAQPCTNILELVGDSKCWG